MRHRAATNLRSSTMSSSSLRFHRDFADGPTVRRTIMSTSIGARKAIIVAKLSGNEVTEAPSIIFTLDGAPRRDEGSLCSARLSGNGSGSLAWSERYGVVYALLPLSLFFPRRPVRDEETRVEGRIGKLPARKVVITPDGPPPSPPPSSRRPSARADEDAARISFLRILCSAYNTRPVLLSNPFVPPIPDFLFSI